MPDARGVFKRAQYGVPVVLVGANGAGKSRFLVALASLAKAEHERVFTISNTVFDRLKDVSATKRISAAQGPLLPTGLIKSALRLAVKSVDDLKSFREIGKILRYCGYQAEIGFKLKDPIREPIYDLEQRLEKAGIRLKHHNQIRWAVDRIVYTKPDEMHRLRMDGDIGEISRSFDFAQVIAYEPQLKKLEILQSVEVFLFTVDGEEIPMSHASSGQLAIISTFVFLAISLTDYPSWLLIDEPENSLQSAVAKILCSNA